MDDGWTKSMGIPDSIIFCILLLGYWMIKVENGTISDAIWWFDFSRNEKMKEKCL